VTFKWTDRIHFFSVDGLEGDTSRAMESPPHAKDDDELSKEGEEEDDDYDSE
jgi:hypothetical protein